MKRPGWGKWVVLVAAGLAVGVGLILLAMQSQMSEMRDAEAFERTIVNLVPDNPEREDYRKASAAFHELRREQDTGKSAMFDAGAGLVSAGLFVLIIAGGIIASRRFSAFIGSTHGILIVAQVCVLVAAAVVVAIGVGLMMEFDRFVYPPWADSMAIPLFGLPPAGVAFFAILFAVSSIPHIRRRRIRIGLFGMPARIRFITIFSLAFYGLLAAAFAALAGLATLEPGGWLLGPALGVAAWLMLHARAVSAS